MTGEPTTYQFDNKIISHADFCDPGVGEALARMSLAWAMQAYPKPVDPTPSQIEAWKKYPDGRQDDINLYHTRLAHLAGSMIQSQVWLSEQVKRSALDILGDICHSENHQNQGVMDMYSPERWFILSSHLPGE